VRPHHPLLAILLSVVIGCGANPPPATVYVTVPQTVEKPTDVARPKPTPSAAPAEPVKPVDPWEEARAYFKRVKETEREATEAKLKKMDKPSEMKLGHFARMCRDDVSVLAAGEYPSSVGQGLLSAGLTELVEAHSVWVLDYERFRLVFRKLNPTPTSKEVINAAVRFATTHDGLRKSTLDVIEKGQDTRDSPETHKAATAWTGK
jgi:hypothetical protein